MSSSTFQYAHVKIHYSVGSGRRKACFACWQPSIGHEVLSTIYAKIAEYVQKRSCSSWFSSNDRLKFRT